VNQQEAAAWEIHQLLKKLGVAYAVIGGMAVQFWGEPRLTQDVDVTVAVPVEDTEYIVHEVLKIFKPRIDNALDFAIQNRVLLVRAGNDCPMDISLGLPGYEDEVMRRSVKYQVAPRKSINICSAEDLIIHKAIASRPQDIRDIESIVYRQRDILDESYIRQWLKEFADILYRPEILGYFEHPWRKIHDEATR
jgi:hypothetical protein